MSEQVIPGVVAGPMARAHAELDELRDLPLDLATDDEVLDAWRGLEALSRRLSSIEHAVIAQATSRHLERVAGARTMPTFARTLLGIDIGDARTRVAAAEACGPRRTITGESLPPICPTVATAQEHGEIGNRHARIIAEMLDSLPDVVQVERGAQIETFFAEQAKVFDPSTLRKLADRQLEVEGVEGREPGYRERRRDFRLNLRPDGSCSFSGEGTAEFAEHLRVAFDSFARPRPETASPEGAAQDGAGASGGPSVATTDPRTPGQRRHDAIIDLIKAAMRAGQIPPVGGLAATVILTVDAEDWAAGTGWTTTGHGVRVTTAEARTWVSGDARVIGVVLDTLRTVVAYSDCHRIFTENQRLAMTARDGGCAFPGCDAPPHQCQAHHVVRHEHGGPTAVGNGALMCSAHHRTFEQLGWTGMMIDGIPHFVPPRWADPQQRPLRNWMHHPHLGSRPPTPSASS